MAAKKKGSFPIYKFTFSNLCLVFQCFSVFSCYPELDAKFVLYKARFIRRISAVSNSIHTLCLCIEHA